jgi:hypothetical protein
MSLQESAALWSSLGGVTQAHPGDMSCASHLHAKNATSLIGDGLTQDGTERYIPAFHLVHHAIEDARRSGWEWGEPWASTP